MALLLLLGIVAAPLSAAQLVLSRPEGDCLAPALTTTSFNFFPSSYQLQSILAPSASSSGLETTVSTGWVLVSGPFLHCWLLPRYVANAALHTCRVLLCILVTLTPLCWLSCWGFPAGGVCLGLHCDILRHLQGTCHASFLQHNQHKHGPASSKPSADACRTQLPGCCLTECICRLAHFVWCQLARSAHPLPAHVLRQLTCQRSSCKRCPVPQRSCVSCLPGTGRHHMRPTQRLSTTPNPTAPLLTCTHCYCPPKFPAGSQQYPCW